MTDKEYILEEASGDGREFNVRLWKPGQPSQPVLWTSVRGDPPMRDPRPYVAGLPSSFLRVDNQLYIGMNSGYIDQIDLDQGKTVARHGPRLYFDGLDPVVAGINGLVLYEGEVYDASAAGLVKTESRETVDDRYIGSVETVDDRLLIVPFGHKKNPGDHSYTPGYEEAYKNSNPGDLVDVLNGEVVIEKISPNDGSGLSRGTHIISGDKVYMHHGDWPAEKITIRNFPSGETINQIGIPTSTHFTIHEGEVYDVRSGGDRAQQIFKSDVEGYGEGNLFEVPKGERLTSMVSGGEQGLLLTIYNKGANRTRFVSILEPGDILSELPGRLWLVDV